MAIKKCQLYNNNNNSMKDPVRVDRHVARVKVVLNLEEVVQNHQLKRSRIHALALAPKNQNQEAVIQIVVEAKVNNFNSLFGSFIFYYF